MWIWLESSYPCCPRKRVRFEVSDVLGQSTHEDRPKVCPHCKSKWSVRLLFWRAPQDDFALTGAMLHSFSTKWTLVRPGKKTGPPNSDGLATTREETTTQ